VSDKVLQVSDADFEQLVLNADVPVLVDFWAPWCGPCQMIAPVLDELASFYGEKLRIAKVNVDDNRATAVKYQVRSIPMLLLFVGGEVKANQLGAVGRSQLIQMIDTVLASE